MTFDHSTNTLQQRLDFIELDVETRETLRELRPLIAEKIGGALDKLYKKIAKAADVAGFFHSESHLAGAKKRQQDHWANLANGNFDASYVQGVQAIGRTHARVGLEPRWYIGGYALVMSELIKGVAEKQSSALLRRGQGKKLSAGISAVVKAAMLTWTIPSAFTSKPLKRNVNRLRRNGCVPKPIRRWRWPICVGRWLRSPRAISMPNFLRICRETFRKWL